MEVSFTKDAELFRLALRFIDQNERLEDGVVDLQRKFAAHLKLGEELIDDYEVWFAIVCEYIRQLAYPSHIAVELLLEHGYLDRAEAIATALTNNRERALSHIAIAQSLLKAGKEELAFLQARAAGHEEWVKWLPRFVETLIKRHRLSTAASLAGRLPDELERRELYKAVALGAAKQGMVADSLFALEQLRGQEEFSSVQSALVQLFVARGLLESAEALAPVIEDPIDREDAVNALLQGLMEAHHEKEAVGFAEAISSTDEKIRAAKFIERLMLSHQLTRKASLLRKRFSLPSISYKRAA